MGKKAKKNRFNKTVDVDVVYSSNTIAEVDPADSMAELNLSKEKAEELQKIRATLPAFSQSNPIENELAKLPTERPYRAFVHNMAFSATENDIAEFFTPLEITNINLVCGENGSRGFCFVDFDSRDDLAKALERNDALLAGRPVNVRIADTNSNERGGRDKNSFGGGGGGGMRRGDGGYDRRRGGYKPASLRDEFPEGSDGGAGEWRRGTNVNRSSETKSSFGSSYGRTSEFTRAPAASTGPTPTDSFPTTTERPKLNIMPRSSNVARPVATAAGGRNDPPRDPKIFGSAKPVDTAARDLAIEQRRAAAATPATTITPPPATAVTD